MYSVVLKWKDYFWITCIVRLDLLKGKFLSSRLLIINIHDPKFYNSIITTIKEKTFSVIREVGTLIHLRHLRYYYHYTNKCPVPTTK